MFEVTLNSSTSPKTKSIVVSDFDEHIEEDVVEDVLEEVLDFVRALIRARISISHALALHESVDLHQAEALALKATILGYQAKKAAEDADAVLRGR